MATAEGGRGGVYNDNGNGECERDGGRVGGGWAECGAQHLNLVSSSSTNLISTGQTQSHDAQSFPQRPIPPSPHRSRTRRRPPANIRPCDRLKGQRRP